MGIREEFAARRTAIDALRAEVSGDRPAALALLRRTDPAGGDVVAALLRLANDLVLVHARSTGREPTAVLDQLAAPPALDE